MKMICENAGKCAIKCIGKEPHYTGFECVDGCKFSGGISGSKCIPYIEPAKEPIERLTDHAKYCRLSKQAGGLCNRMKNGRCITPNNERLSDCQVYVPSYYSQCPYPEKQQPVELLKDPLEELVKEFSGIVCDYANGDTYDIIKHIRTFAEKVRAL